ETRMEDDRILCDLTHRDSRLAGGSRRGADERYAVTLGCGLEDRRRRHRRRSGREIHRRPHARQNERHPDLARGPGPAVALPTPAANPPGAGDATATDSVGEACSRGRDKALVPEVHGDSMLVCGEVNGGMYRVPSTEYRVPSTEY